MLPHCRQDICYAGQSENALIVGLDERRWLILDRVLPQPAQDDSIASVQFLMQ